MGTTPTENLQLRDRNRPEDITDILGTTAFKGYIHTPIQTLDSIYVQQRNGFLPLAKEAKQLAEEIHIEKLNKQWAGIPHEKLLNQSFRDQLNSLQILEQLAPLELAKQHLLADIIDILEHLSKADNIPFNQLYYIAENCVDRYYSKVIETFVSIFKRQFTDRQTLLINTAHLLKFLEEYSDRQAQIWKIFHKHHNLPDDIEDLHLHFDLHDYLDLASTDIIQYRTRGQKQRQKASKAEYANRHLANIEYIKPNTGLRKQRQKVSDDEDIDVGKIVKDDTPRYVIK